MKQVFAGLAVLFLSLPVLADDNQFEIRKDSYGSSFGGSTEIEMRKKYDYDPSNKFRGEVDKDGSVRMKNYDGERLRGNIDKDGYGRLRDDDGNTYCERLSVSV